MNHSNENAIRLSIQNELMSSHQLNIVISIIGAVALKGHFSKKQNHTQTQWNQHDVVLYFFPFVDFYHNEN